MVGGEAEMTAVTEEALSALKLSLPPSERPSGFLISLTRCEALKGEE